MKIHFINKSFLLIFISFSIFLLACQKAEEKSNIGLTKVSFTVSDIDFTDFTSDSSIENIAKNKTINTNAVRIEKFKDFSWELSSTSEINTSNILACKSNNKNEFLLKENIQNKAASIPMQTGKTYVLLVYSVRTGIETHSSTNLVTVNNTGFDLLLPKNSGNYNYYAYSYNTNENLHSTIPANLNNPILRNRTNAPLLFAKGSFKLENNINAVVSVVFKHQASKIEIVIDGQQLFANSFQKLDIEYNNLELTTHDYSLKNQTQIGTVKNKQTISNQKILFTNHQGLSSKQESIDQLYTSTTNPSINIRIKEIVINQTAIIKPIVRATDPDVDRNFTGFTAGTNYIKRALISLKYKGIITSPYEWARGNLYYDDTDIINPYKFADPVQIPRTESCNYYWNFNVQLPRSITGGFLGSMGDPCLLVLPHGKWRTPRRADFNSLGVAISNNNGYVYFNAANNERVYFNETGWVINHNGCNVASATNAPYRTSEWHKPEISWYMEINVRDRIGITNRFNAKTGAKIHALSVRCISNI